MKQTILFMGLLVGCGEKTTEEEAPDLVNTTDDSGCGGTPPVITSVTCTNTGMDSHSDYGELPTFRLQANVTDEDGDLNYYQLLIDFDDNIDGIEDDEDEQLNPIDGAVNGDECETPTEGGSVDIGVTLWMQGSQPKKDTRYEWFIRVVDAIGKTSEPFMVTCTTPDVDGNGDPEQE